MTQDVFLTLILFIDLGKGLTQLLKYNNKEPDELIRAKQGSVATQQHLLFFVFALSSDTSLHSTRLRLVDTPTLFLTLTNLTLTPPGYGGVVSLPFSLNSTNANS